MSTHGTPVSQECCIQKTLSLRIYFGRLKRSRLIATSIGAARLPLCLFSAALASSSRSGFASNLVRRQGESDYHPELDPADRFEAAVGTHCSDPNSLA